MFIWIMQFIVGLLVANAGEWLGHRYILHGWGQRADSFWAYHLYEHHVSARQGKMLDSGYQKYPKSWNSQAKEVLVLVLILVLNWPFFYWANGYACAIYFSMIAYYFVHRIAHSQPDWAKKHLAWHYQHHLVNDNANWCITHPLFDYLMRTRCKNKS
ncbi:MAG: hypothetical protein GQ582_01660 [Methyloprofundus sp.]|nr:hypothetical protein [Methyloprofundus sp.]